MIIKTLVENTSSDKRFCSEHGLSLYIEFNNQSILFDVGGSSLFIKNAQLMGIDLSKIDYVVISHGHYDHGGGLKAFLAINHTATIFINKNAFEQHLSLHSEMWIDIGLDPDLKTNPQVVLTDGNYHINENALLFSTVQGASYYPSMNSNLYKFDGKKREIDDFDHEQNLILKECNMTILFIGCAHRGVVNIMECIKKQLELVPTHVIGGFHMSSRSSNITEDIGVIQSIAKYLKKTSSLYYTGHCTGDNAFRIMKKTMRKQLQKITTGKTLIFISQDCQ